MTIFNYPASIGYDSDINPGWIEIRAFERKSPSNSIPNFTVNLYLPEQLRNPNTVSWGNDSQGVVGNMANWSNWSLDSLGETAKAGITNLLSSAGSFVTKLGGGSASSEVLLGQHGKAKNPFLIALFKGVDFRTFEMSFKFAPYSEADCEVIHNIVKKFRGSALPDNKVTDAILGYPNEFEIRYIWKGEENKYLHKFKRCVLTGLDVNYTGTGQWAVMRNGFPAEIFMTMRFSEIEILLRKDIEEGY